MPSVECERVRAVSEAGKRSEGVPMPVPVDDALEEAGREIFHAAEQYEHYVELVKLAEVPHFNEATFPEFYAPALAPLTFTVTTDKQ